MSYGRNEFAVATRLKNDLEARGHHVWFGPERCTPGVDWESEIDKGIDWLSEDPSVGRVMFLMTPHSVRRPNGYCLNELARAVARRLVVIPIMLVTCEPPLSIARIHWLDMTDCIPVEEQHARYEVKFTRLVKALEENKLDFEGTQARLIHMLQPLDFQADLSQHVPNFVGREWVFERIDVWLREPGGSRVFWIVGGPGVGKTAIAAYLCHKRDVVAFHLCKYGHDDKADPRRCVMSIAYQLCTQLPEYERQLASLDLSSEVMKSAGTVFDNLITQPLARLTPKPERTFLIVIDGLDEVTRDGKNELAEFIAAEFARTPPWIKLLITSRPEREVAAPLQKLIPFVLDAEAPENLEDVRQYLDLNLPVAVSDPATRNRTVETLIRNSQGVFLYIRAVLEDLQDGTLDPGSLDDLPLGLGGIFHRFFRRQFPDSHKYNMRIRPILEMVIAARGPLPLKIALSGLNADSNEHGFIASERNSVDVQAMLGSLFPCEDGHLRPFHNSVVNWLMNPQQSGAYYADIRKGHERLADVCWAEFQTNPNEMSPYSLAHLSTHLLELGRLADLLELLLNPASGLMKRWVGEGDGDKGLEVLTRLIDYSEKKKRDRITAAGLRTQIARIHSLRGQYEDAEQWLREALARTSWFRGRRIRAVAFHELGSLSLYRGQVRQAKQCYQVALHLCSFGFPVYRDEIAANLIGQASICREDYNSIKVLDLAAKAAKQARRAGDLAHLIASERLMGTACKTLGRYEQAGSHLWAAFGLAERFDVHLEKARLLLLLGWLNYDLALLEGGVPTEAKQMFMAALTEAERVGDLYCTVEAKIDIGLCLMAEGNTEEGVKWFEPLISILPEDRHKELHTAIRFGLAAAAHQRGESSVAEDLYKSLIAWCEQEGILRWWRLYVGLGAIYWHTGRSKLAEDSWGRALRVAGDISPGKRILAENSIRLCRASPGTAPR